MRKCRPKLLEQGFRHLLTRKTVLLAIPLVATLAAPASNAQPSGQSYMDFHRRYTPKSIVARLAGTWFMRWDGRLAEQHANSEFLAVATAAPSTPGLR